MPAAEAGMKGHAMPSPVSQRIAEPRSVDLVREIREMAEYLQNSSNSIPVPTSVQESEYLSLAMASARAAADRAQKKKIEARKLSSMEADLALKKEIGAAMLASMEADRALKKEIGAAKLASAEADRQNVFKAVSLATAGFIAGSLIVSRVGHSFDNIASAIHEVARALSNLIT